MTENLCKKINKFEQIFSQIQSGELMLEDMIQKQIDGMTIAKELKKELANLQTQVKEAPSKISVIDEDIKIDEGLKQIETILLKMKNSDIVNAYDLYIKALHISKAIEKKLQNFEIIIQKIKE